MKEYTININFEVDAEDYDEAVEIAREAREILRTNTSYKLRNVETPHGGIEEV